MSDAMSTLLNWDHRPCSVDDCGTCAVDQQDWPCDAEQQRIRADRAEAAVRLLQENWPKAIPAPMDVARLMPSRLSRVSTTTGGLAVGY